MDAGKIIKVGVYKQQRLGAIIEFDLSMTINNVAELISTK